jgi:hypothetical protein
MPKAATYQRTASQTRLNDLAVRAEELQGRILPPLNQSFDSVVLTSPILASLLAYRALHKCDLAPYAANEQGDIGGEPINNTDETSDSMVNDALFGVGG